MSHGFDSDLLIEDADSFTRPDSDEAPPISLEPETDGIEPPDMRLPPAEPDADAVTGGKGTRPRGALGYEKKLRNTFSTLIKMTATNPATISDSAAMILTAPQISRATGNLAAQDARIARGVELLTEGTDSVYLQFALAITPLVSQIVRNHEPNFEPKIRGIRLPLVGWRISLPIKVGIALPWLRKLRTVTREPDNLAAEVFSDPGVLAAFAAQKIQVAWPPVRR